MLQILLAVVFGLFAVLGQPQNPTQNQCLTASALRDTLTREIPGVELRDVQGVDVQTALTVINAMPPTSKIRADQLIIVGMKNAPMAVVAFFNGGCMTGRAALPRPFVDRLLLQIERGGA